MFAVKWELLCHGSSKLSASLTYKIAATKLIMMQEVLFPVLIIMAQNWLEETLQHSNNLSLNGMMTLKIIKTISQLKLQCLSYFEKDHVSSYIKCSLGQELFGIKSILMVWLIHVYINAKFKLMQLCMNSWKISLDHEPNRKKSKIWC